MGYAIQPFEPLAVVGMGAQWGGCGGLDAFERMIFEAETCQSEVLPGGETEGERLPEMQMAAESRLIDVSERALRDAGLSAAPAGRVRVAVLAAGCRPGPQNWEWASLVEDLSGCSNPLAGALERAAELFSAGSADAVLFAAAARPGRPPSGAPLNQGGPGLGFAHDVHGWRFGDGAGAVVWMRAGEAARRGMRVYAVIRAVAAAPGEAAPTPAPEQPALLLPSAPALQDVRGCCQDALAAAGAAPGQIGYVEAFACGQDALDGVEIAGLAQAYRQPQPDLTAALGSAQANIGYLGAAAGLAGLIRAALCLYHRSIPGAPGWSAPKLPALWRGAPFYIPAETRPWFAPNLGRGRAAGVNIVGQNGAFAHLILTEAEGRAARPNRALAGGGFRLFLLAGDTLQDLTSQLNGLRRALIFSPDLADLSSELYESAARDEQAACGAAVAGHHHDEVLREIDLALNALPAAFESGTDWQTPLGSYFTPRPAGRLGGVALVYPGAFNSYPGVGRDLFRLFPGLYERWAGLAADLGHVFRERLLYPRSLAAFSKEDLDALEAELLADPIAMLVSGTALAVSYTHILQETFSIRAEAAFGYSLGENSMMYAAGVWGQGDAAAARLEQSETFRVRLAGPQEAVREYWGMQPSQPAPGGRLWANYLVMAAPDRVRDALAKETRVYLTHINTPRQVVIGGDPDACRRVLAELRCASLQAPFDYALHCEAVRSEYDALAELHSWPVERGPGLRMYSAAGYAPLKLEQAEVSAKIAHMLTTPLDFPRLIERVYADGARVFIEAGAGSNCARWIDETLKGRPHLALSANRRGTDDYHTLIRMLARLFSHRVPMDLSALYLPAGERVR